MAEYEIGPLTHIQDLLNVKNKTQVWLSVELGVSKETINQWACERIKWENLNYILKEKLEFHS